MLTITNTLLTHVAGVRNAKGVGKGAKYENGFMQFEIKLFILMFQLNMLRLINYLFAGVCLMQNAMNYIEGYTCLKY